MSFDVGKIDLSKYGEGSWKPITCLQYDLEKIVENLMKQNPNLLDELKFNNPPIKRGQIYILKTTPNKWGYGGGRKITQDYQVGMDWDEDVGIYEKVYFGNNVAVVKLPNDSKHLQRSNWSKDEIFGIMFYDESVKYDRNKFSHDAYPIFFKRGCVGCPTDEYAGDWSWHDSYGNDYGFPTGSVWAALQFHPIFLNWPSRNPMEVKE